MASLSSKMESPPPSKSPSFSSRLFKALKSKPSRSKLTKQPPSTSTPDSDPTPPLPAPPPLPKPIAPLLAHNLKYAAISTLQDSQRGERRTDPTTLLHSLTQHGSFSSTSSFNAALNVITNGSAPSSSIKLTALPLPVWEVIVSFLSVPDFASLAFSAPFLWRLFGARAAKAVVLLPVSTPTSVDGAVDDTAPHTPSRDIREQRTEFLLRLDSTLPDQLFCFPCASYHLRLRPGLEKLLPPGTANPVLKCPVPSSHLHPSHPGNAPLTSRRVLPFAFLQLALRARKFGLDYGIKVEDLGRRWSEGPETQARLWSFMSRYGVYGGRLVVKVSATAFVEGGMERSAARVRGLFIEGEEYRPWFGVCVHWRDGKLMEVCRCALGHVPVEEGGEGLRAVGRSLKVGWENMEGGSSGGGRRASEGGNRNGRKGSSSAGLSGSGGVVTLCGRCRPVRRCTECPTEYLVEIKRVEDKGSGGGRPVFRWAIVVTRWSDLGDEKLGGLGEWWAVKGERELRGLERYDSIALIGGRGLSGVFEAGWTEQLVPGQRILSLNPRGDTRDVDDDGLY